MRALLGIAFALSGFAGLVYETAWARMLRLAFGGTSEAHATVLAAFMAGLALGALVGGRIADRRSPRAAFRLFALAEAGVALLAVASMLLLERFPATYAGLERSVGGGRILRVVAAAILLLPPTFLMGATLPVLSRALVGLGEGFSSAVGRLYAINTVGGVLGTLATGFVLIPGLGVSKTILGAAVLNAAAAAIAWRLSRAPEVEATADAKPAPAAAAAAKARVAADRAPPPPPGDSAPRRPLLLAAAAFSGAAALGLEVLWSRTLLLVVGSSTQSFAIMLATFLGGIALGSALFARWGERLKSPALLAGVLQLAVAGASVLLLRLAVSMPYRYVSLWDHVHDSRLGLLLLRFVPGAALMLLPAILMGASLPALARACAGRGARRDGHHDHDDHVGADVGAIYAANTTGAIAGALLSALVALPALGVARAASAVASAGVLAGILALLAARRSAEPRAGWMPFLLVPVAIALVAWIPPWNPSVMGKGIAYLAFDAADLARKGLLEQATENVRVNWYRDGAESSVLVYDGGEGTRRSFVVNGRHEATTSVSDMRNQYLLGHLPALMHDGPVRNGLVIALGSGMTAGCLARHCERVTVVELEKQVIGAAATFGAFNHKVVEDPRVQIVIDDGRHYLLESPTLYDVITVDPIHPSVVGSDALYSLEQYQLVRSRLAPGGIAAQWLPLYQMGVEDARAIARTFFETFPDAQIWVNGTDSILIGGAGMQPRSAAQIRDVLARPEISKSLANIRQAKLGTLLAGFTLGARDVARYVAGAPVLRDDRPLLEFSLPWQIYAATIDPNLLEILRFSPPEPPLSLAGLTDAEREQVESARAAVGADMIAIALRVAKHTAAMKQFFSMALQQNPDDALANDGLGR